MVQVPLHVLALACVLLASYIAWKQRHAASCPSHSTVAGRVAWVLVVLSLVAGIVLLIAAWLGADP